MGIDNGVTFNRCVKLHATGYRSALVLALLVSLAYFAVHSPYGSFSMTYSDLTIVLASSAIVNAPNWVVS